MFAVVEFTEDSSVDVVPCVWVNDGICFWPPYRSHRLSAAVRKAEEPLPVWGQYAVRVLHEYGELHCIVKYSV